jgi:hypothetical protein
VGVAAVTGKEPSTSDTAEQLASLLVVVWHVVTLHLADLIEERSCIRYRLAATNSR